jgi:hypothetical protein
VEDVLVRDYAAIVHLDINEVGIDSIDSRAVSFEKHDGGLLASVTDERGG